MAEIKAAYELLKIPISEAELMAIFRCVDSDQSGQISFSEFCTAAMPEKSLTSSDKLQAAFRMFDKDGSGLVSANELKQVLESGG